MKGELVGVLRHYDTSVDAKYRFYERQDNITVFSSFAPTIWNHSPVHLHARDIRCGQFMQGLKTFVFGRAYSPVHLPEHFCLLGAYKWTANRKPKIS
jgi:hypothetical protein